MNIEEVIDKWEKQLAMWRRVMNDALMYTKEDRQKAAHFAGAIASFIEDLRTLSNSGNASGHQP